MGERFGFVSGSVELSQEDSFLLRSPVLTAGWGSSVAVGDEDYYAKGVPRLSDPALVKLLRRPKTPL